MSHHTHAPEIRRAGLADAAALADLGRRTFIDTFGADNSAEDLITLVNGAYGESIQRQELDSPHLTYFLAESAGVPVAFALLRSGHVSPSVDDPTAIELQRLYVDRAWHGTGLAQRLMTECVRLAVAHGAGSLFLGVWERNAKALRFYAAQGFVVVGSRTFMVGSDAQVDLVMCRPLGE
jgi:ribosomal protein S18 acetylase RimI-like enzyme